MKKILNHFFIIFSSIVSIVISILNIENSAFGYENIFVLPLTYLIVHLFIFTRLININKFKVSVYFFITLSWIRYVFIPFGSSVTRVYNAVRYVTVSVNSIEKSILLTSYELFITSVFLYALVYSNKNRIISNPIANTFKLRGNKLVYAAFLFLSLILYIAIGRKHNLFNFFVISIDDTGRIGDSDSTMIRLITSIFKSSLVFLFVWTTSYFSYKYYKYKKYRYVIIPLIIGVINIGIIVGERRISIVYTGLVVLFVLTSAFKEYKKQIMFIVLSSASIVVLGMSIYKHFSAFYYGSYASALQNSSINLEWLTRTANAYFFGTQNVAIALDLKEYYDFNIINLLYDFGRSIFGLSFLLKDRMPLTSQLFNSYIYNMPMSSGHVISGIGYGYIYLGAILSPLIVCVNIYISIWVERLFINTNSFEGKYIMGYVLVRFATNIFVSSPPLISLSTNVLFTTGLVYLVARLVSKNNQYSL